MRIDEFPAFLNEKTETAAALQRLQTQDAADRVASGEALAGWAEWPDG